MAKRFTDTDKWKRAWFADLSSLAKLVWLYILDECDHCGVWHANFKRMAFDLGETISREAFEGWFKGKAFPLGEDRYFIPSFITFQQGKLSAEKNAHKPIRAFLERHSLSEESLNDPDSIILSLSHKDPIMMGPGKGNGKSKGKGNGLEGGAGETKPPADAPPLSDSSKRCADVWLKTLEAHKQPRKLIPGEDLQLVRAIQRWDAESVELALIGIRHEKKSTDPGGFDPAQHVSLNRVLDPERFARFVGLGAAEAQKRRRQLGDMPTDQRERETAAAGVEETEPLSTEQIRAALGRWSGRKVGA